MHFFLHGGMAKVDSDKNKRFFQNICRDGDKILICTFATEDRATWEERFLNYQKQFAQYNPEKQLSFELASENIDTFEQQIDRCSVIYFGWGYEDKIFAIIKNIPNLRALLQNKVIVWSSAGTNIWTKYFFTQDFEEVREWLWWLPIKTICHRWWVYSSDPTIDEKRLAILDAYGEKLPIYKIAEQEYIEMKI